VLCRAAPRCAGASRADGCGRVLRSRSYSVVAVNSSAMADRLA